MVLPTWDMHALRRADKSDEADAAGTAASRQTEVDDASTNADESDEADLCAINKNFGSKLKNIGRLQTENVGICMQVKRV